jgi:hypothetical protein
MLLISLAYGIANHCHLHYDTENNELAGKIPAYSDTLFCRKDFKR